MKRKRRRECVKGVQEEGRKGRSNMRRENKGEKKGEFKKEGKSREEER